MKISIFLVEKGAFSLKCFLSKGERSNINSIIYCKYHQRMSTDRYLNRIVEDHIRGADSLGLVVEEGELKQLLG